MRCTKSSVSILGWDAIYDITWRGVDDKPIVAAKPIRPGSITARPAEFLPNGSQEIPQPVGSIVRSASVAVPLSSQSPEYTYLLRIDANLESSNRCDVQMRSVVERRRGGRKVDEKVLYAGSQPVHCGGE
jgi:hypothetical protein